MTVKDARQKMLHECQLNGIETQKKGTEDILIATKQLAKEGVLPEKFMYSARGN